MYAAVDHSLLGTVVRLAIGAPRLRSPKRVARQVFAEMHRLSAVFNRYDDRSDLSRLRANGSAGRGDRFDTDLVTLLELAGRWHERTGGLFDPAGDATLPWSVTDGRLSVDGPIDDLDLNAIAKGWIVDRAAERIGGWSTLVIDAGGDVLHRGAGSMLVSIEDPHAPWDNASPLATVELCNQAIATSGPSRRGDHIRDPRSGRAPTGVAGASVVAADAATADVIATVLAIAEPAQGVELASDLGVEALIVAADGTVATTPGWP